MDLTVKNVSVQLLPHGAGNLFPAHNLPTSYEVININPNRWSKTLSHLRAKASK